jgi:predicted hotdog family 3-hydroxylacyl-ACP dehydratase
MTPNSIDIPALIPHAGSMVLLDAVEAWDATTISCLARSHTDLANPLRRDDHLPAICGIEYAGQSIALHGALLSGKRARPGFLVSIRDLVLHSRRLDDIGPLLTVEAGLLASQESGVIYRFSVRGGSHDLVSGRLTIALE